MVVVNADIAGANCGKTIDQTKLFLIFIAKKITMNFWETKNYQK